MLFFRIDAGEGVSRFWREYYPMGILSFYPGQFTTVNYKGSILAIKELQRILQVEGNMYIGMPIGQERVMFNAHRIYNPKTIIESFNELDLIEFSAVDDCGKFIANASIEEYIDALYALGIFHFRRLR